MGPTLRRDLDRFGLPVIIIALAVSCVWLVTLAVRKGWWNIDQVVLNLIVALVCIAFTIAVVNWLYTQKSDQQYLNRLLAQMRAGDRGLSLWALRELKASLLSGLCE